MPCCRRLSATLAGIVLTASALSPTAVSAASAEVRLAAPVPFGPGIAAAADVLMDIDTGRILWQSHAHTRRAPASLTKIFTAMVAVDVMRMDAQVTVPRSIRRLPLGSTMMGLRPGDRLSVRELLYGLFLSSGNDAAETLAQAGTSRAGFVARMNDKARRLGLSNTHFVNPTGLDESGQYASAYDLAAASAHLERRYPQVARIASRRAIFLAPTATHHAFYLVNPNRLLASYPGATGLKTGFTAAAGPSVIATATRGDHRLLAVVLGSPGVFPNTAPLLDYGFSAFV